MPDLTLALALVLLALATWLARRPRWLARLPDQAGAAAAGPAFPLPRTVRTRPALVALAEALGVLFAPFVLVALGALALGSGGCRTNPEGERELDLPLSHGLLVAGLEFFDAEAALAASEGDLSRQRAMLGVRGVLATLDGAVMDALQGRPDWPAVMRTARVSLLALSAVGRAYGDPSDDVVRYGLVGVRGALAFLDALAAANGAAPPEEPVVLPPELVSAGLSAP